MGIYIKGMEMPKCCAKCELCQDEMLCKVTGLCVDFSTMYDNRMYNCPLTEVSEPHGDLVDNSEIGKILIKALDECEISEADKGHVLRMVWIVPTVIEGSEADD